MMKNAYYTGTCLLYIVSLFFYAVNHFNRYVFTGADYQGW